MVMAPSVWHDFTEDPTSIAYHDSILIEDNLSIKDGAAHLYERNLTLCPPGPRVDPAGLSGRERSRALIAGALKDRIDAVDHDECVPGDEDAFFVADLGEVYRQHQRWVRHLPNVHPHYAVKCNPAPELVRYLASLGTGFDCASKAEIDLVLSLGVSPDRIVYAQPVKTNSYLNYAKTRGVKQMTFDNTDELRKIAAKFPGAELLLRIATDDSAALCQLSMKFGAAISDCPKLLKLARALGLNVVGVAFHVGSGASDPLAFRKAVCDAKRVFDWGQEQGHEMTLLDVGGGFSDDSFDEMAGVLRAELDEHFPADSGVRVIAEPGRYYAATAFTLACHVIARRVVESGSVEFGGPDGAVRSVDDRAGAIAPYAAVDEDDDAVLREDECRTAAAESYMLYLNDGVYGNFSSIMFDHQKPIPRVLKSGGRFFYDVPTVFSDLGAQLESLQLDARGGDLDSSPGSASTTPLSASAVNLSDYGASEEDLSIRTPLESQLLSGPRVTYSIWGPTCDGIDCIAPRVELSEKIAVGDWMYFENMGAYTMCSATRFNGFPNGHDIVWVGGDDAPGFQAY